MATSPAITPPAQKFSQNGVPQRSAISAEV
jgi:hypothetical protein